MLTTYSLSPQVLLQIEQTNKHIYLKQAHEGPEIRGESTALTYKLDPLSSRMHESVGVYPPCHHSFIICMAICDKVTLQKSSRTLTLKRKVFDPYLHSLHHPAHLEPRCVHGNSFSPPSSPFQYTTACTKTVHPFCPLMAHHSKWQYQPKHSVTA
jgi:hypothetical protein